MERSSKPSGWTWLGLLVRCAIWAGEVDLLSLAVCSSRKTMSHKADEIQLIPNHSWLLGVIKNNMSLFYWNWHTVGVKHKWQSLVLSTYNVYYVKPGLQWHYMFVLHSCPLWREKTTAQWNCMPVHAHRAQYSNTLRWLYSPLTSRDFISTWLIHSVFLVLLLSCSFDSSIY